MKSFLNSTENIYIKQPYDKKSKARKYKICLYKI